MASHSFALSIIEKQQAFAACCFLKSLDDPQWIN